MEIKENNFKKFEKSYWSYYLELEQQVLLTKRYVEFDPTNYKTFSGNYLLLIQAICSEIDVVGKAIASNLSDIFNKENGTKSINRWWFEIQDRLENIDKEIRFGDSFTVTPWRAYRVEKQIRKYKDKNEVEKERISYNLKKKDTLQYSTPKWWNAYNKIKHHRMDMDGDELNYKKANLFNLANCITGLFLLESEYMKKIGTNEEWLSISKSKLFEMEDLTKSCIDELFVNT